MKGIVVVGVVWASVDSMHVQGPTDAVVSTREVGRIVHLTIRFPEEMRGEGAFDGAQLGISYA